MSNIVQLISSQTQVILDQGKEVVAVAGSPTIQLIAQQEQGPSGPPGPEGPPGEVGEHAIIDGGNF